MSWPGEIKLLAMTSAISERTGAVLYTSRQAYIICAITSISTKPAPIGSQRFIDLVALDYHRLVAERLQAIPETVLREARENLQRWLPVHEGSGSQLALLEWQQMLETKTVSELIAIITEDSEEGQRLRSSTPFAGYLSDEESRPIWRRQAQASFV